MADTTFGDLKLYNTLTRQLEPFKPLETGKVKLYVCGPTVYDVPHLGHARCYLTWDILYRLLKFLNYDVTYARNITDVDDKILERANQRGQTPQELTQFYTQVFEDNMDALNILTPTLQPRATAHIESMITFIGDLINNGSAYTTPAGDVYFDTSQKADYGKLCQQNLDDLQAGTRVQVDEHKRNPLDFALWKQTTDANILGWDTPWGNGQKGRPGWHIECSTMIEDVLGTQIDIHAGGYDLVFPHHENEIAQSEAHSGQVPFVKYWLHNGFVNVSGEKMSKSLGNFATLADVMAHYDANTIRYFVLTNHYRVPVDFNPEAMQGAKRRCEKIGAKVAELLEQTGIEANTTAYQDLLKTGLKTVEAILEQNHAETESAQLVLDWQAGMTNDLNTAQALASLNGLLGLAGKPEAPEALGLFLALSDALGFAFQNAPTPTESTIDTEAARPAIAKMLADIDQPISDQDASFEVLITTLLAARQQARADKNWALSDQIRDVLLENGIKLIDQKDAPTQWIPASS